MNADLHTHTTASDGIQSPIELLANAREAGVEILAITDHDTIDGYLAAAAEMPALRLIPGIEFSTRWQKVGIHVVGLNIDPGCPALLAGISHQKQSRVERGEQIARKLAQAGFTDTLDGATRIAGAAVLGRPHFAQYLVESGQVKDIQTAFRKYLGRGKPGDVRDNWATLENIIQWITASGGQAIVAHPLKYKLTHMKLAALADEFASLGGQGLEVISGRQRATDTDRLARLADRYGLLASLGSDFHQPGAYWAGLGEIDALPSICRPVWEHW